MNQTGCDEGWGEIGKELSCLGGFIEPSDGSKDAFVHISAVERAGLTTLNEGQKVEYELVPGQGGKSSAENLVVVD